MKIYISGKINGLPFADVAARFEDAEMFLELLGFEPVNPVKNGLSFDSEWKKHMVKDIENLLHCDAIFMLDGWNESTGAGIEYDIAIRTGKQIWFESTVVHDKISVMRIQNAIHEVTGMKFNEYLKSRKSDKFLARMLFVEHCRRKRMKLKDIAMYIQRKYTTVLYLLRKYEDERKFNPAFKEAAQNVEKILNRIEQ